MFSCGFHTYPVSDLERRVKGCSTSDYSVAAVSAGLQMLFTLMVNVATLSCAVWIKMSRCCKTFGCLPFLGFLCFFMYSICWFSILISYVCEYTLSHLSNAYLTAPCTTVLTYTLPTFIRQANLAGL